MAFGLESLGLPPDEIHRRVYEVAAFLGIEAHLDAVRAARVRAALRRIHAQGLSLLVVEHHL